MIVQAANPQSRAEMIEAHKQRQARYAAAARNVQVRSLPSPKVNLAFRPFVTQRLPMWQCQDIQFDAHVWAFVTWRIEKSSIIRRYIRKRCLELGVDYAEITRGGQSRKLVPVRDTIVYEIKTKVDPNISWPVLGRHMNRDHSSMISAFYRGAALAGDHAMAEKIEAKRRRNRNWIDANKARGE